MSRAGDYLEILPLLMTGMQSWFFWFADGKILAAPYRFSAVTWSISTEFFLYAVFPLVAVALARVTRVRTLVVTTLAAASLATSIYYLLRTEAAAVDAWAEATLGLKGPPESPFSSWLSYFSPYVRFFEFLVGCLLAKLHLALRDMPVGRFEAMVATVATGVSIVYLLVRLDPSHFVGGPLWNLTYFVGVLPPIFVLVFVSTRYRDLLLLPLQWRPLVALGEASYSIYMIHVIVIAASALPLFESHTGFSGLPIVMRAILIVAVVLASSLVLYRTFELPAQQRLRSLMLGRR